MKRACSLCGSGAQPVARILGVCAVCLKKGGERAAGAVGTAHRGAREAFGLPCAPPRTPHGVVCHICANECVMGEAEMGYCGIRGCTGGRLVNFAGAPDNGLVDWYFDPLPTNCVAGWVCAAAGKGYPRYSYRPGVEHGYRNLAVFYRACTFDCLFCQNWHYRRDGLRRGAVSAEELSDVVTEDTACICYFGGDPTPQLAHALAASKLAAREARGRILRICWETNGSMGEGLLGRMMALSLESGGCVKFDLKAWDERLHTALTGASNRQTMKNFAAAARLAAGRNNPPALVASTLLVSGYVGADEVAGIAGFIASLDSETPYSLLAFHPDFCMSDLPVTSRAEAERCMEAALSAGLKNVHLGNAHVLR